MHHQQLGRGLRGWREITFWGTRTKRLNATVLRAHTWVFSAFCVNSLPVTVSNGGLSHSTGFPSCPRASASASQRYVTTEGQSASLSWCQAPIRDPLPIFLLLSLIVFRQLRVCWWAPPLMRGRVFSFELLLGLASAVSLGSESRGTHGHILYFILRTILRNINGSILQLLVWSARNT
jgi:hypothetical protein